MTGNHRNTPKPYQAKPRVGSDAHRAQAIGTGDKPQVNRFDRIDRHIRQLIWLVAINLVLSAALLVVALFVLDGHRG